MDREDRTDQDDLFQRRGAPSGEAPDDASGLRYEGPVRGRRHREPARRPGTPFLAAALLAGAVVVLVGFTLILRSDDGPDPETSAALVTPPPPLEALPSEETPTDIADARLLPSAEDSPARAVTGESSGPGSAADTPAPPRERAPATPSGPPAPRREPPAAPASAVTPPPEPAPAALPAATTGIADVGELVRNGDIDGAFRAGKSLAREAAGRGDYTIQVLSVRSLASVREAFSKVRDNRLVVVSLDSGQGTLYRLLWGFYPTREEAQRAAASCPRYFPRSTGWPFTPPVAAALKPPAR